MSLDWYRTYIQGSLGTRRRDDPILTAPTTKNENKEQNRSNLTTITTLGPVH